MKYKSLTVLIALIVLAGMLASACSTPATPTAQEQPVLPSNLNTVVTPGVAPSAVPDPVKDPVIISKVIHDSTTGLETIYITNISSDKQDISGYTLILTESGVHVNVPPGTSLDPNTSYKVYNGATAKDQKDGLAWLDNPVLLEPGNDITLLNKPGRVIWTYIFSGK